MLIGGGVISTIFVSDMLSCINTVSTNSRMLDSNSVSGTYSPRLGRRQASLAPRKIVRSSVLGAEEAVARWIMRAKLGLSSVDV
jgi:hypothetical protein